MSFQERAWNMIKRPSAAGWYAMAEDLKMMHGIDIGNMLPPSGVLVVEGCHEIEEEKTEPSQSRTMQEAMRGESHP
jgi:hypothetical protein